MDILPDKSILLIQILNFLFLLLFLNLILYRPIRRIIRERKARMDGLTRSREDFEKRAVQSDHTLLEQTGFARQKGQQAKMSLIQEALDRQDGLLKEAVSAAEKKLEQNRETLQMQAAEARRSLDRELADFSKALAEKMLGRRMA